MMKKARKSKANSLQKYGEGECVDLKEVEGNSSDWRKSKLYYLGEI